MAVDALPLAARMIEVVKKVDTTRPVTAACAAIASNLYYPQLDIVGYNYQEQRYADDHARMPGKVIYGSENSQGLNQWLAVANNDYICGQFLWTAIDFIGESGPWPSRGSGAGFLDLAGFKKPQFYFRQSLWSEKPMVHLMAVPFRMGRGMMGGAATTAPASTPVSVSGARTLAQRWLDGNHPGVRAEPGGDRFPGYFTFETLLDGRIEELIYLGDHVRTRLSVAGHNDFIVKVPNTANGIVLKQGERARVGWAAADCRALDAASFG
jgi:hypothetical protein